MSIESFCDGESMHLSRRSFLGAATAAAAGTAAAVYAASSRSSSTSSLALASTSSRAGDVVGKITVGYQGWFACVGDHSPIDLWWHWSQNESLPPAPSDNNLKAWPDGDIRAHPQLQRHGQLARPGE
jgi:hypothetical protein